MNLKELSVEYDRLYEEASTLFKGYNPCQFVGNQCARNRRDLATGRFRTDGDVVKNGCCGTTSCKHLTSIGCGVKSLGCKLYACYEVCQKNLDFYGQISTLTERAERMFGAAITTCFWEKKGYFDYLARKEVINGSKRVVGGV